jgi:hypothetical protein
MMAPRWDLERHGKHQRPSAEVLEVSALVQAIRKAPIIPPDAERIIRALKDQELIETVVLKASSGFEGFFAFLNLFRDYKNSPYVRVKLAYGHSIGRRHCNDIADWVSGERCRNDRSRFPS